MPVPEGFEPLDIAARWGVDDAPDFVMHSGPIYVREDGSMPKLGFEVLPHMCNPGGVCHGGLLMGWVEVVGCSYNCLLLFWDYH